MHSFFLILISILVLSGSGCSAKTTLQKKYGSDIFYFLALKYSDESDKEFRFLRQADLKSSDFFAELAMQKLAHKGSVQERINRCEALYKRFPSDKNRKIYVSELYNDKEFSRIIKLCNDIDLKECDNETAFFYLSSLNKKNDSRFFEKYFEWCTERPFSSEHYRLYCEIVPLEDSFEQKIIDLRVAVYKKKFTYDKDQVKELLLDSRAAKSFVISDAGKLFLYGSDDYFNNALYFDSLDDKLNDSCRFYSNFYAGRLYDKADDYRTKALNRFDDATKMAFSDSQFDNALWYYLNTNLKISITRTIDKLDSRINEFKNPSYYDDFFDTLSVRLMSQRMYEDFYRVTKLIYGKASKETVAKYSYISARLIQDGKIKFKPEQGESEQKRLFEIALDSGTDLHYRVLAVKSLNMPIDKAGEIMLSVGNSRAREINPHAELLMYGLAEFGLYEKIYDAYLEYRNELSDKCIEDMASFLKNCASSNDCMVQSIRMASYIVMNHSTKNTIELLKLAYPRNFQNLVEKNCSNYSQKEYLLYGLIRSESFFKADVVSHAGAVGLTQLMESTASDVARKLKVPEYDLKSPETSIMFGSFYLEELTRRLDNSIILAALSYNSGITRVRSWVKSAALEFQTKNPPKDLFLEALPFEETRGYGRKINGSACMYGWLYYGKHPSEVAAEIMN